MVLIFLFSAVVCADRLSNLAYHTKFLPLLSVQLPVPYADTINVHQSVLLKLLGGGLEIYGF